MTFEPKEFLRKVPKVSLHDHLDGGLRPQTIIELHQQNGTVHQLLEPLDLTESDLTPENLQQAAYNSCNESLVKYLQNFEYVLPLLQTKENIYRVVQEAVEDYANDNIIYAEIRYAPELFTEQGLSYDEIILTVKKAILDKIQELKSKNKEIYVYQILCAMRQNDNWMKVAEYYNKYRINYQDSNSNPINNTDTNTSNNYQINYDLGSVVAFDLAGPEAGFPVSKHPEVFQYLYDNYLLCTLHAGEDYGFDSMNEALLIGHAKRLGHGVAAAQVYQQVFNQKNSSENSETTLSQINFLEYLINQKICLECCPSSNLQTHQTWTKYTDIGLNELFDAGFSFTINTDNRFFSKISLSDEFINLLDDVFTLEQEKVLLQNSINYAFGPVALKQYIATKINTFLRNTNF